MVFARNLYRQEFPDVNYVYCTGRRRRQRFFPCVGSNHAKFLLLHPETTLQILRIMFSSTFIFLAYTSSVRHLSSRSPCLLPRLSVCLSVHTSYFVSLHPSFPLYQSVLYYLLTPSFSFLQAYIRLFKIPSIID